ncbi:MAG TPA: hypothetical protein GX521_00195, partial [Firmicutes bacterium]|nr:hypothetical protein [Bacillota bacterium]
MTWPSPFSFILYLCLFAMQAFVARSVIERPTALKELIIYGTASAAVHLVTKPCPVLIPKILFVTAAHVALHRKVFKAPIFPDAVASVALPLSLGFSSHQILLPLLSWLLETELDASVREFLFFLPSLLMAAYYGLRQMLSPRGPTPAGVQPGIRNIGAIAAVSILLHIRAIFNLTRTNGTGSRLSTVYAVAGTVLAAIVAATLLRQIRQTEQQRKKADY